MHSSSTWGSSQIRWKASKCLLRRRIRVRSERAGSLGASGTEADSLQQWFLDWGGFGCWSTKLPPWNAEVFCWKTIMNIFIVLVGQSSTQNQFPPLTCLAHDWFGHFPTTRHRDFLKKSTVGTWKDEGTYPKPKKKRNWFQSFETQQLILTSGFNCSNWVVFGYFKPFPRRCLASCWTSIARGKKQQCCGFSVGGVGLCCCGWLKGNGWLARYDIYMQTWWIHGHCSWRWWVQVD